jgi:hypothetical protein
MRTFRRFLSRKAREIHPLLVQFERRDFYLTPLIRAAQPPPGIILIVNFDCLLTLLVTIL